MQRDVLPRFAVLVASVERAAGFVRVERGRRGLTDAVSGGVRRLDELTIVVYQDAEGRTVMRITPAQVTI